MKNELTNAQCLLILAALLAGVVAVMGCYTVPEPTRVHTQERLVITTRGNVSLFDPCVTNKLEIKGAWHGGR